MTTFVGLLDYAVIAVIAYYLVHAPVVTGATGDAPAAIACTASVAETSSTWAALIVGIKSASSVASMPVPARAGLH